MTDSSIRKALDIAKSLVRNKIHLNERILLEPRLFKYHEWPKEIEKANYRQEMYRRLKYAFIRPGLGTLVDCLSNQVCPICFNETTSMEMLSNNRIITSRKLGLSFESQKFDHQQQSIMKPQLTSISKNLKSLDFDGSNQFCALVMNLVS